jgi:hypothetical protein
MGAPAAARIALAISLVTGALAYTYARVNYPDLSIGVSLCVWAGLPSALAAGLLWREPKRLAGSMVFGAVTSFGGLLVFARLALAPEPEPDTARHLAPFL